MKILQKIEQINIIWAKNWHTNTAEALEKSGAWSDIRIEFKTNKEGKRKITFRLDKNMIEKAENFCQINFEEELDWNVIDMLMNLMVFQTMEKENALVELEYYKISQLARAERIENANGVILGVDYTSPEFLRRGTTTTAKTTTIKKYFR